MNNKFEIMNSILLLGLQNRDSIYITIEISSEYKVVYCRSYLPLRLWSSHELPRAISFDQVFFDERSSLEDFQILKRKIEGFVFRYRLCIVVF